MRRRAGGAGCGARAGVSHTPVREASGNRPLQLRGTAFNGWTGKANAGGSPRDQGGEEPAVRPRKRGPEAQNPAVKRRKARRPA